MSYAFIELSKFNKSENDLLTLQDKWLYFFKNWNESLGIPETVNEPELIEAYDVMERFNWNTTMQEAYLKATIAHDEECYIKQEEFSKGRDKGLAEGHEKGLAEGHEKGLAEGHEKGLAEGHEKGVAEGLKKAQIEIAKDLIKKCLVIDEISKITKLSSDEILNLKNN